MVLWCAARLYIGPVAADRPIRIEVRGSRAVGQSFASAWRANHMCGVVGRRAAARRCARLSSEPRAPNLSPALFVYGRRTPAMPYLLTVALFGGRIRMFSDQLSTAL